MAGFFFGDVSLRRFGSTFRFGGRERRQKGGVKRDDGRSNSGLVFLKKERQKAALK
jgi:hypothetical protein